ncbi:aklavinone 12-hydroxylase RdmE [Spirillospora sp. NPDC050679]
MTDRADESVDVLVVGAGLAGLSAAMFLALRGVRVLVVERHAGPSVHPKAAGQNPRTMELLRAGGVADKVRHAGDIRGRQGDFTIKVAESVGGKVLHTFAESFEELVGATAPCTPMPWALVAQDQMEPILLDQARRHGAVARYGTELTGFAQDGEGVTAELREAAGGAARTVRARYMVAADGPYSRVRERLGIGTGGHGSLATFVGVIFEADLSAVLPPGATGWYYLQNPHFTGTFGPTDRPDRHTFFVEYDAGRGQSPADFTDERCRDLIRIAVGAPGLSPVLLDVQPWEMAARIAERWRDGRVFLAGDAAKVTPPTGGLGGNTAIGDGFDIAWKLAAVIEGVAGPGLLDSYEPERKAVAELVVAEALNIYASRMAPHMADEVPPAAGYAEVILGFRYRSGAVLPDGGPDDGAPVEDPLRPSGRPGFRAPHVGLERDGGPVSTVELFGQGWVLVTGPEGAGWSAAARKAAARLGVRLEVVGRSEGWHDPAGDLAGRFGLGPSGAALVRPDGVIAWRSPDEPGDPGDAVFAALARVLDR